MDKVITDERNSLLPGDLPHQEQKREVLSFQARLFRLYLLLDEEPGESELAEWEDFGNWHDYMP